MIIYNQRTGGFWRLMEVMEVLSFEKKYGWRLMEVYLFKKLSFLEK